MAKRSRVRWRVAVVTSSRADYGLLYWVMKELDRDRRFTLQLVVTGMHLSPEFGHTVDAIERDRFVVSKRVEMLVSSDTGVGVAKSVGLGTIGLADAFAELKPDCVLLLGDRFELLAAAQAAHFLRIPVAHIAGGDVTRGAFDDAVRHAITKIAHVHFVTNAESARRVKQMGEDPARVFNHGSPGLDYVRRVALLSRTALAKRLEFVFQQRNLLVTFHPVTLGDRTSVEEFGELLDALDSLGAGYGLIFTRPNADTEGRRLIAMIDEYVARRPSARVYSSLGQELYLSALSHVDAVVGNSSSGFYEAPSFGIPTVNIGHRQADRLRAASVFDTTARSAAILRTIRRALRTDCSGTVNPYGDGRSAPRIVRTLAAVLPQLGTTQKQFRWV